MRAGAGAAREVGCRAGAGAAGGRRHARRRGRRHARGADPARKDMLAHRKLLVVGDPGSGKQLPEAGGVSVVQECAEGAPLRGRIEAAVLSTHFAQHHTRTAADPRHRTDSGVPGRAVRRKESRAVADYFRARLKGASARC